MTDRATESDLGGRHPAPLVRLQPNHSRILEALLYLLTEAERREILMTQYAVLKTFFLADRSHLNKFGRPISFDNYSAMKDGPVASFVYDILKHSPSALKQLGLADPLWEMRPAPQISEKARSYSKPKRQPNLDVLSKSDVDALSDALTIVASLSFTQLRKLTHEDAAYIAAWRDNGGKSAYQMSYGLLFEIPDFAKAQTLSFLSRHV